MIRAWRIVKSRYAAHAFDGEGSRLYGSRWNSPGIRVVHTSETLSLAVLEILAHLQSAVPLPHYLAVPVQFEASFVERVELNALPRDWRQSPPSSSVQQIGDLWVRRASSAVLQVPSVLIPHESNYLLNPAHRDFARIHLGALAPLDIDPRVLGRAE